MGCCISSQKKEPLLNIDDLHDYDDVLIERPLKSQPPFFNHEETDTI
jgi:hypothetical protein